MDKDIQVPSECKHFCSMSGGLCSLDIKETKILGGGFWIKCCDIATTPNTSVPTTPLKKIKMDKTLQDLAWRCLPSEVRKGIKWWYKSEYVSDRGYQPTRTMECLTSLFGHNNLTSDAEGEEMLTVPRKRVMEIYNHCNGGGAQVIEDIFGKLTYDMNNDAIITPLDKFKGLPHLNEKQEVITDYEGYAPTLYPYEGQWFVSWVSSEGDSILDFQAESPEKAIELTYNHLFGTKCLPDEVAVSENATTTELKPAEPKFKVGDKVKAHYPYGDEIGHIQEVMLDGTYDIDFGGGCTGHGITEDMLEPYTEQKEEKSEHLHAESVENLQIADEESHLRNLSQETANCDKEFDTILKDGFRNERRLNIAAMAMQGLLANPNNNANLSETVADALNCADTLIAEVEKGNSDGED